MDLRANTAVDVLIGPFVDITDGNTTEDSLTLTQAEIKLSKNGQALTQKTDATSAVFDDDGYYNCELDATDTGTEGNLVLIVHQSANALPVRHEFNVLAEAAWDSLYAAKDTGYMDVNVKAINDVSSASVTTVSAYQGTTAANTAQTGDTYTLAAGVTGFSAIDTVVDAILVDTGTTLPAALTTIDNFLDTEIAAILVDTGTTLQGELDAIQAAVITNASGTDIAADIIALKAETVLIVADTNELQADDTPTTLSAIITDLDDIKGTGFVKDTHSLTDIEAYVDILDDGTSGNAKIATDAAAILVDTATTIPASLTIIDDFLDTEIAAIKAVTDLFQFTATNFVDCSVEYVNGVQIQGTGTSGDEMRPV